MSLWILAAAASTSALAGLDPAWIAFLGAAFGGAGLKLTEAWLGRNKVKIDDASLIRGELRQQATDLRVELTETEKERDSWREKYYAAQEQLMRIRATLLSKGIPPPE